MAETPAATPQASSEEQAQTAGAGAAAEAAAAAAAAAAAQDEKKKMAAQRPNGDARHAAQELDDFGLPVRPKPQRRGSGSSDDFQSADEGDEKQESERDTTSIAKAVEKTSNGSDSAVPKAPVEQETATTKESTVDADSKGSVAPAGETSGSKSGSQGEIAEKQDNGTQEVSQPSDNATSPKDVKIDSKNDKDASEEVSGDNGTAGGSERPVTPTATRKQGAESHGSSTTSPSAARRSRGESMTDHKTEIGGISEWSHQALAPPKEEKKEEEDLSWQAMPTDSKMDYYDDFGHLVAKGDKDWDEDDFDPTKGGAGKGYTRVQLDDDAQSATSMDEHTAYLFKNKGSGTNVVEDDGDEEGRNPLEQMQATKDLLTEGQRIAYVGVTRLSMEEMRKEMSRIEVTKKFKKDFNNALESLQMWSQKMMVRLYAHMDISSSEQVMIEQLAEHGIKPSDMTQALMQNARVRNPLAEQKTSMEQQKEAKSPRSSKAEEADAKYEEDVAEPPPPYTEVEKNTVPEAVDPSTLENNDSLDLDLRWTILCDLFLVLISDSIYDARSRVLLETVGEALEIPWLDICRFEKRVTDALEMQEEAANEDWDESETVENRRKMALKKKYLMMGLATAGGGLLIGLSAGMLAPVIGAGLAAGFSAIGVAGTTGFLAGAGGAAIITTSSAIAGGSIAIRASHRRMGAVRTFEYRPLHNNKRVNLILTVSGWMNGRVDDVRLPFSTVDPIMGDIYSLYYEPDMLTSMGDTIRILATEALTQGLQQVLAATFLSVLMAGLSAPIILSKVSYLIDNPWSSSLDRAERAGLILADSIIDRHLGVRPITLVGFSLGSKVIFSCLKELSNRGAYGLVQNVYIFGSPVIANKEEWLRARTVVSGRLVNGYASNDWILGYLFRATGGGIQRVAGLAPVENVPGVENFACAEIVNGHMAYRAAMPRLLREVGWEVASDEFTEIEEADPENHEGRQRELIQEIEEAREAAAAKEQNEKRRWWGNKKKTEKKGWETYDNKSKEASGSGRKSLGGGGGGGDDKDNPGSVIFDIDAIRRELESEHMEVKQLESTLPPMQLSLEKPPAADEDKEMDRDKAAAAAAAAADESTKSPKSAVKSSLNPFASLRGSKSYNASDSKKAASSGSGSNSNSVSASPRPGKGGDGFGGGGGGKAKATTTAGGGGKGLYDYDEDEDADPALNGAGGITMSFDQPHQGRVDRDDYDNNSKNNHHHHNGDHDDHDPAFRSSYNDSSNGNSSSSRPPLKSTTTTPANFGGSGSGSGNGGGGGGGGGLEHNAWADDETHGEEGEITMTFA